MVDVTGKHVPRGPQIKQMELIPSIDILDGRVVQLHQGDYDNPRDFSMTPLEAAKHWANSGARRLHVVDLNGVRQGHTDLKAQLEELAKGVGVPIQASGGIRNIDTAQSLIEIGVQRIVFGTAAITAPQVVKRAVDDFGSDRVVVRVDVKEGAVATDGWTISTGIVAIDLINQMKHFGVSRFMYRDVDRDGTLEGPRLDVLMRLVEASDGNLIVAGGIGTVSDLESLANSGIEAVVLGTSIYTGAIDFERASIQFNSVS